MHYLLLIGLNKESESIITWILLRADDDDVYNIC